MSEKGKEKKPKPKDKRPEKKKYPEKDSPAYRELCEAADQGWPTKIWSDN